MITPYGHLSYCTNIHPGEKWHDHFIELKKSAPEIRKMVPGNTPFGLGLRLSGIAAEQLLVKHELETFIEWLKSEYLYVFTINGFPYGGFHHKRVKDQVHHPDWTSRERVDYTLRLTRILHQLIRSSGQKEGGISTSPLSYAFWWTTREEKEDAIRKATENILEVVLYMARLKDDTGIHLHLDIEPEPDGLLEDSRGFIQWYQQQLIPLAIRLWKKEGINAFRSEKIVREHLQLCFDVCHFAIEFENPTELIKKLEEVEIGIGKVQISSALKLVTGENAEEALSELAAFDEPVYLHQVVVKGANGSLHKFRDLHEALAQAKNFSKNAEWRVHYHVPLFMETFGLLGSTQQAILETLAIQKKKPFTQHLEVETYTWSVLPKELQLPVEASVIRELQWVKYQMKK